MSRNFGVTTGRAVGGNQPDRSLIVHDTQHENVIQLADRLPPGLVRLNSRSQEVEPFISPFELGSHLLFLALLFLPVAIVCGVAIAYLAFAPEFIQQ